MRSFGRVKGFVGIPDLLILGVELQIFGTGVFYHRQQSNGLILCLHSPISAGGCGIKVYNLSPHVSGNGGRPGDESTRILALLHPYDALQDKHRVPPTFKITAAMC